ncbi:transposase [Cereibacter azotoformans]|uniref:Transposase zinc-ribbon domain-containing protein n=1 Tax=Cereibacter sphaeroides (strain ATCC 17025 / ATH 2.4.3) TaxID=349102 RepID=A4WSF6_CERS5|nr:transposase [Cereibacter azotoformans]ULB09623.1 transposase [Cereibacter azotoformans]
MADDGHEPDDGLADAIYWYTLALRLPREGISAAFPSEADCRARLAKVRWPDGPACARCGSLEVFEISTRAVLKCRSCKHQFSVTSGTDLRGSHIDLRLWFGAAERAIRYRKGGPKDFHIPATTLAAGLGVYNVAARRMKKIILADLAPGGPGLLREAVCLNDVRLPAGLVVGSPAHLSWLATRP